MMRLLFKAKVTFVQNGAEIEIRMLVQSGIGFII